MEYIVRMLVIYNDVDIIADRYHMEACIKWAYVNEGMCTVILLCNYPLKKYDYILCFRDFKKMNVVNFFIKLIFKMFTGIEIIFPCTWSCIKAGPTVGIWTSKSDGFAFLSFGQDFSVYNAENIWKFEKPYW